MRTISATPPELERTIAQESPDIAQFRQGQRSYLDANSAANGQKQMTFGALSPQRSFIQDRSKCRFALPQAGTTCKLNVTVCTRLPLTAQSVTGIVWFTADELALNVIVAAPLTRLPLLMVAVTPEGRPEMLRFTVPNPNDLIRAVAETVPETIDKLPEFKTTLKSAYFAVGTPHPATGETDGAPQLDV